MDDNRTAATDLLTSAGAQRIAQQAVEHLEQAVASTALRGRMLPFTGWSDASTGLPRFAGLERRLKSEPPQPATPPPAPAISPHVPFSAEQIVERATAVLMAEMTKPHIVPSRPDAPSDSTGTWVEKAHDVIEQIADLWRSAPAGLPGASGTVTAADVFGHRATDDGRACDRHHELSPRPDGVTPAFEAPHVRVRPGGQATVLLTLQNREHSAVTLRPIATDLLSSRGGAIPAAAVRFSPSVASLNAGEDADLTITVDVPQQTGRGCYSGLIVVVGTDSLRALITVEVDDR